MPFYVRVGEVPPKRHTQFRRPDGVLYTEELIGNEGFVAGSRARAAFIEAFHAATHEALVKYAHDLAHECLEHGMDRATADYIVVEMARHILGENWMPEFVDRARKGGIERVLL